LRIYNLKRMSIPKLAVLATGLAAAVLVATINPSSAQATPRAANCAVCHAAADGSTSTVTATPSTMTPVAGATYTVAITLTANPKGGNTGYGIVPVTAGTGSTYGGNTGSQLAFTANMTAPAAAGTYNYTVYTNQGPTSAGLVGSKVYSITVSPVVTTPPTTTTTPPPTTTTTPPPTTTTPPVLGAVISALSPVAGAVGDSLTITGSGFGTAGAVKFGTVNASVSSWTGTSIVVTVPAGVRRVAVTVTPAAGTVSNAVTFKFLRIAHLK
jgi:large repetitive protein